VRLRRLVIHQFRGVKPGTVLEFSDGINVILGENGTGKTTLLELVSMIARSDFSALRHETFELAFTLELPDHTILEVELENKPEQAVFPEEQELLALLRGLAIQSSSGHWRYRLSVVGAPQKTVDVRDGQALRAPKAREGTKPLLDLFDKDLITKHAFQFGLFNLASWSGSGGRFDEALGSFHEIIEPSDALEFVKVDGPYTPLDSLPLGVALRFSERLGRGDSPETLRFGRSDDPVLDRICELLTLVNLSVHPRFSGSAKPGPYEVLEYSGFDLIATLDCATPPTRIPHERLSFGQKRMFSFLWQLASYPQGVVIADELVNGLHYSWIAACIEEIGDRQALIASQNPLLMDFLTFDSAEQARRTFVLCSAHEQEDGHREWEWRNLTADEAESFFRAHQVGIQHVSEILRTKGLW
jgi:energy-coupling factor transporter ATP-binding protein EcfA2